MVVATSRLEGHDLRDLRSMVLATRGAWSSRRDQRVRRDASPGQKPICFLYMVRPFGYDIGLLNPAGYHVIHDTGRGQDRVRDFEVGLIDAVSSSPALKEIMAYTMKTKDEAFDTFKRFHVSVETDTGEKLKTFWTDRGGEFLSKQFTAYYMARNILKSMHVPEMLWGEVVHTQSMHVPETKALNDATPYEMWTGRKPQVDILHTPEAGYEGIESKSAMLVYHEDVSDQGNENWMQSPTQEETQQTSTPTHMPTP
ncbi:hypothetical protein L2E82_50273 [Cichorium intybus]|nr:hypothetical protein L2E82_50273 [Cichorium intybus]